MQSSQRCEITSCGVMVAFLRKSSELTLGLIVEISLHAEIQSVEPLGLIVEISLLKCPCPDNENPKLAYENQEHTAARLQKIWVF